MNILIKENIFLVRMRIATVEYFIISCNICHCVGYNRKVIYNLVI